MNTKYKPILQEKVVKERKEAAEQAALRKKYGIKNDKKIIQIKKEHVLTAIGKITGSLIRKCIAVILIILAFNGLIALLHPDTRLVLQYIYNGALIQLSQLIGL